MTDSGLDEGVGVLEFSKHHLEMITFRFERLPGGRHLAWNARFNMVLSSDFLYLLSAWLWW